MAKMLSQKYGDHYDPNQEMFATGLCSVFGAFFSSMATSTAPPRCILGKSSGGRTQLAHLFSACVVLLCLLFIAPLLEALPVCILGCLITVSVIPLFVFYKNIAIYWHTSKYDLVVYMVSFLAILLLDVNMAMLIGVGFSLFSIVIRTQQPYSTTLQLSLENALLDSEKYVQVDAMRNDPVQIFKFDSPLYFATLDIFRDKLYTKVGKPGSLFQQKQDQKASNCHESKQEEKSPEIINEESEMINMACEKSEKTSQQNIQTLIIDCSSVSFVDTGGATMLAQLHKSYGCTGMRVILANVNTRVEETLRKVKSCDSLINDIHPTVYDGFISP